ncbi:HAD family phosphatase [Actinoplanes sp. NEAU-A12]|uniref:HAD family phosphatase n=1 Tax=Actinoplanes sandaracinus TaxID=3045177 RepID=A0ABT6X133_9ACTN|nr:HAD family phosphatase [Actinoplanes sandaracinus]MDI6105619.1 HAD family phosphatase [Actinoplanes sandaracinus]
MAELLSPRRPGAPDASCRDRPRAVWTDFGGVLTPPLAVLFDGFERRTGLSRPVLEAAIHRVATELGMAPLAPIELATLTEREWGARLATALRGHDADVRLDRVELTDFGRYWFREVSANADLLAFLGRLKQRGYLVGLLTNNVVEWEPYWTAMLPMELFDAVVDSCRVGVRKPDPEIYELAAARLGLTGAECLLLDDLTENCVAAEEGGWRAVRFRDNEQAMAEVCAILDVPVPPVARPDRPITREASENVY